MKKLKKKINKLLKTKKDIYLFFVAAISILIFLSVVRYAMRSYQIPIWDEQHYMHMSTAFYRMLQHPTWSTPYDMLQVIPSRQPGYALLLVPFYFMFGLSKAYFWAQVTNGVLYVTTIVGIYFLAKLYLSRLASFLAALIFACYGWTLFYLNQTYSENAVSAFCVLSIFFLLKSGYFQKRKYGLLFGLSFGIAILIKYVSLVYVFGPLVYVGYHFFAKRLYKRKMVLITMLSSFLLAFLIIVYPYYSQFSLYFENWSNHRLGGPIWELIQEDERNPFSLYSLTFYLNSFAKLGILYFLLFLSGLFLAFKKKSKLKPILFAFLIGYIFSVYAILKAERHILPIFPYVAILSASVFDYVKKPWFKTVLVLLTVLVSVFSFLGSFWGKGPMKQNLATLPVTLPFGEVNKIYLTTISRPPYIYKLSGKEIVDYLAVETSKSDSANPKITMLFSYRPLDEPMYTYNQYHLEKPLQPVSLVGSVVNDPDKDAKSIVSTVFEDSDYLLVKTGKRINYYFQKNNYQSLEGALIVFDKYLDVSDYYEKKAIFWIYQDSSEVIVYKKKRKIGTEKTDEISEKLAEDLHEMKKKKVGTFAK